MRKYQLSWIIFYSVDIMFNLQLAEPSSTTISSCLADGSWSNVSLTCPPPQTVTDMKQFNISKIDMSSTIIIGILSAIIILLLALIVICFRFTQTCKDSTSTKSTSSDSDISVISDHQMTTYMIILDQLQAKYGVIVYDNHKSSQLVESDFHAVLDNYSLQSARTHRLTTFDS